MEKKISSIYCAQLNDFAISEISFWNPFHQGINFFFQKCNTFSFRSFTCISKYRKQVSREEIHYIKASKHLLTIGIGNEQSFLFFPLFWYYCCVYGIFLTVWLKEEWHFFWNFLQPTPQLYEQRTNIFFNAIWLRSGCLVTVKNQKLVNCRWVLRQNCYSCRNADNNNQLWYRICHFRK